MKAEDLVLTIEQMLHLKELGLKVKDTAFVWYRKPYSEYELRIDYHKNNFQYEYISTLTLQEILEMLPKKIENTRHEIFCLDFYYDSISYIDYDGCLIIRFDLFPSPLQSLYNILCWVAENGYLNNKENENN